MVWKKARVMWKGEKATRHFTRDVIQSASVFYRIDVPEGTVQWHLQNENDSNPLDVSFQANIEGVRADITFFQLGQQGSGESFLREDSRPTALSVRRNVADQVYYFEAIVMGWTEEEDEDG